MTDILLFSPSSPTISVSHLIAKLPGAVQLFLAVRARSLTGHAINSLVQKKVVKNAAGRCNQSALMKIV